MKKELGLAHCPALQAYYIPSCEGQQVQKMRKDSSRKWYVNLPLKTKTGIPTAHLMNSSPTRSINIFKTERIRNLSPDPKRACVSCFIHPHMVCLLHRLTRTCNIKHQSCKSIYHYSNYEVNNRRNCTAFCYLHLGIIPFLAIVLNCEVSHRIFLTFITPLLTIRTHRPFPLFVFTFPGVIPMIGRLLYILPTSPSHTTLHALMRTI